MDIGIQNAIGQTIKTPLPLSWLGLNTMPLAAPAWANTYRISLDQTQNLIAQIGYDKSTWNYQLVGNNNQLGRYQFSTQTLENYGLLAPGSNAKYGTNCVNYRQCWQPTVINSANNANYDYNITSLYAFLNSQISQDHLAYQLVYDLYSNLTLNNAVQTTDSQDVVAGMIYVAWNLGYGLTPTNTNSSGTGAYAWRYWGIGNGVDPYNSGRYAVTILSQ
jgi:hypothetical protein